MMLFPRNLRPFRAGRMSIRDGLEAIKKTVSA